MTTSFGRRALFSLVTNDLLAGAVRRLPVLSRAGLRAARRYVAGTTRDDAFEVAARLATHGVATSIDLFGEMVSDSAEAERVTGDYVELAKLSADLPDATWLAVDLSHVGLDISPAFCRRQLARIVEALPMGRWLQVGAEDSARTDAALDVVLALAGESAPLTMTVQANLRRSPGDALRLAEAEVPIRLVKGADVEPPAIALSWGRPTDLAYARIATDLAEAGARVSLATHDDDLREGLLAALGPLPIEMLYGVRHQIAADLVARGLPVRLYVPFGDGWLRYWLRRLAESRGA